MFSFSRNRGSCLLSTGKAQKTVTFGIGNRTIQISRQTAVLVLVLLLGAVFRLWQLDRWSLWTDELYTLRLVRSLRILAEGVPDDQHPPLYYLLMHYWTQVSEGEVWVRLPSAIASFLALPLMWRVGRLFYNDQTGVTAVALLALSPLHIWYAREARMYGVVTFFWVASLYFYFHGLKRDRWLDLFGLALATSIGLFLTYSTLGLWALEISMFWLLWHLNGRKLGRLLRWLIAQAIIAVAFYSWWPFFQQQLARSNITFDWPILASIGLDLSGTLASTVRLAFVLAISLFVMGVAIWLLAWWQPRLLTWIKRWHHPLAVTAITLFVLATIAGAIPRGLSIRRQLLVFWPICVLMAGWALVYLQRTGVTAVILVLSFALSLFTVFGPPYEDWRGTAEWLATQATGNDIVLLSPHWIMSGFDYYYDGVAPYERAREVIVAESDFSLVDKRIWLVISDNTVNEDFNAPVEKWFETHAEPITIQHFSRTIVVTQYEVQE